MCDALYDETLQPPPPPENQPEPQPAAAKIKAKKQVRLGKTVLLQTVYKCAAAGRRRPVGHEVVRGLIRCRPREDADFGQSLTLLKLAGRSPPPAATGVAGDMVFEIAVRATMGQHPHARKLLVLIIVLVCAVMAQGVNYLPN